MVVVVVVVVVVCLFGWMVGWFVVVACLFLLLFVCVLFFVCLCCFTLQVEQHVWRPLAKAGSDSFLFAFNEPGKQGRQRNASPMLIRVY